MEDPPDRGALKSLMLLWRQVLLEWGTWCHTSTTRDYKTASSRFEHEGVSFLTITLPNFCVDFQKSLDQKFVGHDQFSAFAKNGGLPRFLGGFLDLVFDRGDGKLLDNPSIDAIRAVRQLTQMFGKILLPCSDVRKENAIDAYVQCEQEVRQNDQLLSSVDLSDYARIGRLLYGQLFSDWDLAVFNHDVLPKHGPGSTADRLSGNGKWEQSEWTQRLESILPSGEYLLPSWRYWQELDRVSFLEPGSERPVRVITVPKTLKTPRIIAIEPTCMQYMQQGLLAKFRELHEKDDLLYSMIGFDDQAPNQRMAQKGSHDGSLATLDLSEASDRVSNQLVRTLLRNTPWLAEAVDATRSRKADVPGHGVIRLAKFASMGSALCFPFEAMVFLTVVLLGIERRLNSPLTRRDVESLRGKVRVYGDDIIVPVDYVSSVVDCLETFGFKVNSRKSYWTGKFRESCGGDFYDGKPVKVIRVRQLLPENRKKLSIASQQKHVDEVVSTVSLRNQLYELGYRSTCQWIDDRLTKVLKHYPIVDSTSPILGRVNEPGSFEIQRVCEKLHRPMVKGFVTSARLPVSKLDGTRALLKVFSHQGYDPLDEQHLMRAGRSQSVDIKLRWGYSSN